METTEQSAENHGSTSDLPEAVPDESSGSAAAYLAGYTTNFLPPDQGEYTAQMLNIEIMAHAHTEMAYQVASIKASGLERHCAHQTIALAAWQSSYQQCQAVIQNQAERIKRLKEYTRELKQENERLSEEVYSWHDTFRPASA